MNAQLEPRRLSRDALWYKDAVIYEVHVRAFFDSNDDGIGDFAGLTRKLDYIQDLGVTTIWLLPFYPSPGRDDGYDIADYHNIHPQYGTRREFRTFVREAHRRGLRVITELVINHTSDAHPWFQAARRAEAGSPKRNFYVWSDTPDRYAGTRIIFRDTESSNWSWDPLANAYYWHRFFGHQPDLNFDNPHVVRAVTRIMEFWLAHGVDGFRLDAIPYLVEREGTNNENLRETHDIVKRIRQVISAKHPDRMLLAEANQWPEDVRDYFGDGDECHMAYHFPLMPRMYMAIAQEDRHPIVEIMDQTPDIPDACQWAVFLRNHAELTLEMVTSRERDYMYQAYAADTRSRLNLGIRRRLAPLMENDPERIKLMNSLLLSMPGSPIIYYGDEIGMGDNFYLGDRNGVRTPMQWSPDRNAGFSRADPQKLYLPVIIDPEYRYEAVNVENQLRNPSSFLWWTKRLLAIVRKHFRAFGRGEMEFLYPENNKILAFIRKYKEERLLVAMNLSRNPQFAGLDLPNYDGMIPQELFGATRFPTVTKASYMLTFAPYGYYIFNLIDSKQEDGSNKGARGHSTQRVPVRIHVHQGLNDIFEERWGKEKLESEILPPFIKSQRWFRNKASEIEQVSVRSVIRLSNSEGSEHRILLVTVSSKGVFPENYFIPIAFSSGEKAQQIISANPEAVISKVSIGSKEGIIYDGIYDENFGMDLI